MRSDGTCVRCGSSLEGPNCDHCGRPLLTEDIDYLNKIEELAQALIMQAYETGILLSVTSEEDDNKTAFDFTLIEMARSIKRYHYPNDGWFETVVGVAV